MRLGFGGWLSLWIIMLSGSAAHAQLTERELRLWVDTDLLAVAWVKDNPSTPGPIEKNTVFSVGPNQLGAYRLGPATTPLGVGVGYVLRSKWLIGARVGFGYDLVSPKDGQDIAYLAWSFMPGVWFVPGGDQAKWYLNFSPLLDYVRQKQGDARDTRFGGCFAVGAGSFVFLSPRASLDVGFFFEAHFIDIDTRPTAEKRDISDLRWLIRVGASLWR